MDTYVNSWFRACQAKASLLSLFLQITRFRRWRMSTLRATFWLRISLQVEPAAEHPSSSSSSSFQAPATPATPARASRKRKRDRIAEPETKVRERGRSRAPSHNFSFRVLQAPALHVLVLSGKGTVTRDSDKDATFVVSSLLLQSLLRLITVSRS